MKLKYFAKAALLLALVLALTGCGEGQSSVRKTNNSKTVEDALSQQMAAAETAAETAVLETSVPETTVLETAVPTLPSKQELNSEKSAEVDYDLTEMSGDMVYATVYQMLVNPSQYIGKTIKMNGPFYSFTNADGSVYYPVCIIEDALACCAQGMEFVVTDAAPEDYPEVGTDITVIGVFETYLEDNLTYCHLVSAVVETNS